MLTNEFKQCKDKESLMYYFAIPSSVSMTLGNELL